jgi:hypothetical protein
MHLCVEKICDNNSYLSYNQNNSVEGFQIKPSAVYSIFFEYLNELMIKEG